MLFRLDGINANVSLNGTDLDDGPTLVWSADNLEDGDHQLWVVVNSLKQNGSLAVDYLEYVAPLLRFVTRTVLQRDFCFLISGLRIRLETASILSGLGQTQRMYPKKRPS